MGLLDSFAAIFKRGGVESRPQNATYSQDVMDAFGVSPAASGMAVTATTAMRVSAVSACVTKISGAIISMPLHIYRLNGGDIPDRLPRDNLWYLLNEQPSPQYTSSSHWEGVSMAQLLRGDAFTLIKRDIYGSVKELLPLPWGSVSPIRSVDGGVRYYVNMPTHGIGTWYEAADILHFPGLGFDDVTMRSMSVIQYGARNAVGNALAMDEYSGKFFANGAHPSISLESPKVMNPEQILAMQQAFVRKYSGVDNAHKFPLVLTEGVTAKEISLSADDAQLIESRRYQVQDIARAFGVPGFLINDSSGQTSWGPGLETNGKAFVKYTLNSWLRKIEQELNRKLYPRNTGRFVEFYRDALEEGDLASQGAYFRTALGGPGAGDGHMSVNEVRKIKRMAPIDGGDEVYRAPRDTGNTQPEPDAKV